MASRRHASLFQGMYPVYNCRATSGKTSSLLQTFDYLKRLTTNRFGLLWVILSLYVAVSLVTRAALALLSAEAISWNATFALAWPLGLLFDLGAGLLLLSPAALLLAILPRAAFRGRLARPLGYVLLFLAGYGVFFGAIAEWFFWDEFGARFNFIAVDYVVYTTEVIGNIRESYPIPLILTGVLGATVIVTLCFSKIRVVERWQQGCVRETNGRWLLLAVWVAATLAFSIGLNETRIPGGWNSYNRELAKNGLWSLFAAFRANELEFDRYYPTTPIETAFARVQSRLDPDEPLLSADPKDLLRMISNDGPERRLNVIQITVESLSASFLRRYGEVRDLTPNLDQLVDRSVVFDRFYATGTRTDRGMEALTLSVPPTPGRSLVKRPQNSGLFTLGSVFRGKGYETAFIYGGFGYFDNMNEFFGGNGYRVVDRTKVPASDITFANVWGACDEDLYRWTLREADEDFAKGKPFFYFVMTTSNHRPYTFPDGKIDLPSKISGRAGAVKYTDFAIGEFLRAAASRPWFKDTLFVIVGDHCASSAGKTTLPMENYQVPLMIYSPGGQLEPRVVADATSQIDYAPTLLGQLRWSYPSRFFGRDVLSGSFAQQDGPLFIGTYQKLGMYRQGAMAVLQPLREAEVYDYDRTTFEMKPCRFGADLIEDTVASYQVASWLFRHRRQREVAASESADGGFP